jgi:CBS domain-containing protein
MLVCELMRRSPRSCTEATNLASVTELLWTCNCGALPVLGQDEKVIGIVTDRDICVALGTRNARPSELRAADVMSAPVVVCGPGDEIHSALKTMHTRKVRRLPAVNSAGELEGILCISDLIVNARHNDGHRPALSYEDVMSALKGIYSHHSLGKASAARA